MLLSESFCHGELHFRIHSLFKTLFFFAHYWYSWLFVPFSSHAPPPPPAIPAHFNLLIHLFFFFLKGSLLSPSPIQIFRKFYLKIWLAFCLQPAVRKSQSQSFLQLMLVLVLKRERRNARQARSGLGGRNRHLAGGCNLGEVLMSFRCPLWHHRGQISKCFGVAIWTTE